MRPIDKNDFKPPGHINCRCLIGDDYTEIKKYLDERENKRFFNEVLLQVEYEAIAVFDYFGLDLPSEMYDGVRDYIPNWRKEE